MTRRWLGAGAAALLALGFFSIAFSLLAERGLWPQLPPGALHDSDLIAGFAVAIGLVWLLARPRARPGSEEREADRASVSHEASVKDSARLAG